MMKLISPICLLAFVVNPSTDRFQKYHAVQAYEIRPGVIVTPIYSANHDVCEISIEKRHYFNDVVNMEAAMSKEEIVSLFDELVPQGDRGGPGLKWKLPPDTEISELDGGVLNTRIPYANVTLAMYGKKDSPERQKYITAIISWNKLQCDAK